MNHASLRLWGVTPTILLLSFLFFSLSTEGKRPELVSSSVWFPENATLLNLQFEAAVVQMDFDQPLYTNGQSFLCADYDVGCPELSCKACDWSGQEPTGCDDPECCGPAQSGDFEAASKWCSTDGPSYETLRIGETSRRITLNQGERVHVRFFVPEEYYCRPIMVLPRPYYGSVSSSFSTLEAFPSFSTVTGWRTGNNERNFGFGQSSVLFCPNTDQHPEYNVGTYSGMFYAVVATEFEVEIVVSPEAHPLPAIPESDQNSCSDVPAEVMNYAGRISPAFCVENGVTYTFDFAQANPADQQVSLALPIPRGCHTISFFLGSGIPGLAYNSHHLYCLPSKNGPRIDIRNSGYYRSVASGQTWVLTQCFEEEITYMFCAIRFRTEEYPVNFVYATNSPVIRKNLMDIPDSSLAYMDGLQAGFAMNFGQDKYPCIDFFSGCYDWVLPPSDDALFFFPPPSSPQLDTEQTFEDLQEFYRNAGLQEKKENRLTMVVYFKMGSVSPIVNNVTSLSLIITHITNVDGEVVSLPGGGVDTNPEEYSEYSISRWVNHIPFTQLPDLVIPRCDTQKYATYQQIVLDRLQEVGTTNTLEDVLSLKYSLDTMNEAILAQSCTDQVADNLDTFVTDVVVTDSTDCLYDFGTLPWVVEPCCNVFLTLVSCCLPFDYNSTIFPYGDVADVSDCGEPECAQSYYEDLSFSFNNLNDESLGCTSGVTNPSTSFFSTLVETMRTQYLVCLQLVGFGNFYEGMDCQIDSDCNQWLGICHENKCALPPLDEVENEFLECYIQVMPSSLESYLKRNILPPSVADFSKNSTEFYEALFEAATQKDCVHPENPLEINYRTRYQGRPLDYGCLSEHYGLTWPEDEVEVVERCPGQPCLRSFGCLINTSSCIFDICQEFEQEYILSSEEECPQESNCDIEETDDCDGSYCVYCPENGDLPCERVRTFTNQGDCEDAFACELPDGSVDFTMSEEECRQQGLGCTTDCAGDSCESIYNLPGGCFVPSLTSSSDCSSYSSANGVVGEWMGDSLCVLTEVELESACELYPSTEWETCQQIELDDCTGGTQQQRFLGCYVSLWHTCQNQEECESSGRCTDRDFYTTIRSYDPVNVQYAQCLGSGEYVAQTRPFCSSLYETSVVGCVLDFATTPSECSSPILFFFTEWVGISRTEEECLAPAIGKMGCQLFQDPLNTMLWIMDEEECECQGGRLLNAWDWIPGVWEGGVPRRLEWKEAERRSYYEYRDSLSFVLLADWIQESTEEQFLYPIQSQIICESQSITNPVFTLVCDCLADGGEECYDAGELQKVIQMGLSEVCQGEETFVKDPSAQVDFDKDSVSEGCSFLNISIIYRNWFSAPFVPPPLSFKWQEPRQRGVVINDKETTVGEVLGDGLVLSFSNPRVIESFHVCLRASETSDYDVPDFGYTTRELESIWPLGLEDVVVEERGTAGTWYCSIFNLDLDDLFEEEGTIRIFPVDRMKNFEDEEDSYTDHTTRVLCYTLGAFYCLVGLFCVIALALFVNQTIKLGKTRLSLPNVCSSIFLLVCIFRATFLYLYPIGTFEDEPLTYFILFETPTFLLFSVLIFMIYSFKRLVYKKGFFPGNPTPILMIGWPIVWAMWVIVLVVYSEVILDDSGGSSPCQGRVEVSYEDEEDSTRTLAITYQTVIIVITIFLTSIFFYYTAYMYKSTKKRTSGHKQFVIVVGGSFNVAFAVRTVLFLIILVADFASAVYLFCTLLFCEVLMMIFLLFQFNIRYFRALATTMSSGQSRTSLSGTGSGSGME